MEEEGLTTSLLEEVFSTVDSQSEIVEISGSQYSRSDTSFLSEEYNTDLDAALGKKRVTETKNESPAKLLKAADENECSLIHEDEINDAAKDDPFRDGENKEWITSTATFTSLKPSDYFADGTPKNVNKWSDLKIIRDQLKKEIDSLGTPKDSQKSVLFDPVFRMRIINPKVSTAVLKEKMIGRESVPPLKIKRFVETRDIKDVNWVTGGAIVGKLVTKSQKGNQYCVWTLSDLNGDIKMVSVLLFGTAFKEYSKLSLGVVVGILNASVLNNKNNKTEATLRVDNSDRIMVFGISKDYGTCRSKKKNGENCTAVVNKSSCEYCIYHVKQVYDRASRRPELQASFTGNGLTNLRNKVLGKNEVFYGGKLYTAVRGKQSIQQSVRERERIKLLSPAIPDTSMIKKDKELLQRLSGEVKTKSKSEPTSTKVEQNSAKSNEITRSVKLVNDRSQKQEKIIDFKLPLVKQINDKNQKIEKTADLNSPALKQADDKCRKGEKMIDLDLPITNKQILRARANAIKFIRENGPLKKPGENVKAKRTPEQIKSIKRKLEEEEIESKKTKISEDSTGTPKSLVKQKMERSGITEKFLEIMNSQPENKELLKEAESEEREKYFKKLEIKEKMEEKMASTYKIECKAVRCLKCNYKSFSAADLCKKEKHPLKLVNAIKRFWKCGDCSARTVCLELVPLHSCKVCGSSKWERASMLPEKKSQVLPDEKLSIRGHEEKFVGSVVRNPNINLLVPDE